MRHETTANLKLGQKVTFVCSPTGGYPDLAGATGCINGWTSNPWEVMVRLDDPALREKYTGLDPFTAWLTVLDVSSELHPDWVGKAECFECYEWFPEAEVVYVPEWDTHVCSQCKVDREKEDPRELDRDVY